MRNSRTSFSFRLRPRTLEDQAALDKLTQQGCSHLSKADSDALLKLIEAPDANYRYFFWALHTPDWIGYLEAHGFFSQPPALERIEDRVVADDWPELRYLERMTQHDPHEVGRIARVVSSQKPDNPRIHDALFSITAKLFAAAPRDAEKLLNSELSWIADQPTLYWDLPQRVAETSLVAASAHCTGSALRAVRTLLALEISDAARRAAADSGWLRMDNWTAKEVVDSLVIGVLPVIDPLSQPEFLDALVLFLGQVAKHEFGEEVPEFADAAFQIRRPAIEDHEQNDQDGLVNLALEALRNAAEALALSHGVRVLERLEEDGNSTLLRISLYIRRLHPSLDPKGTERLLSNPAVLKNATLLHELFALLQDLFESLPHSSRKTYLEWADGLADPREQQLYYWPVRRGLHGERLERYQKLVSLHGEIEHPDLPAFHETVWVGPVSPFSVDEMTMMNIPELTERLNAWEYTGGWHSPEPEGLARELAAFAARESQKVSAEARAFEELAQPTFVRGIVQGLADAIKNERSISWVPVLDLCNWAVRQERGDEPEGSGLEEFDRTWGPARKQIARLLKQGASDSIVQMPLELKESVWSILSRLLDDSDPTQEAETEREEYQDPSTIAINTVRGVALGATFSYALWVARHNPQNARSWASFGLTETARALEKRLADDISPSARSVFGKWLPYLFWLDADWTKSNLDRILPASAQLRQIWTAAWEAYLMFSGTPYMELLGPLRASYERSVAELGTKRPKKARVADPAERLGSHLILHYRHGALDLADPLLLDFFGRASTDVRYSTMATAVRGIQDIPETEKDAVLSRLQLLWAWRLAEVPGSGGECRELSSFGWWFLKDVFSPEWRLEQLTTAQACRAKLEMDGRVLEKLREFSGTHPANALACLESIVRNPRNEHWGIYDDHVKAILGTALASTDTPVHEKAVDLVHYIGSLGSLSFGELLSDTKVVPNGRGDDE